MMFDESTSDHEETVPEKPEQPATQDSDADAARIAAELARLGVPPATLAAAPGIYVDKMDGGEVNAVKVVVAEALRLRALEPSFLEEVQKQFVDPGQTYHDALATLRSDRRVVVLRSRPGSGTRTAAVAMLQRLATDQHLQPHHLGLSGQNKFPTAALGSEVGQAYLMDLPADDEDYKVAMNFGRDLMAASATLTTTGSYLIIITEAEQWNRIGGYVQGSLVCDLQAPQAEAVARKWLEIHAADHKFEEWFAEPGIAGLLASRTPGDAIETALLMKTAVSPGFRPHLTAADLELNPNDPKTDLCLRIASVIATRGNWRRELLAWHKTPGRTPFHQTFLLATAVLRGFPVSAAYKEAKNLCSLFEDEVGTMSGHSGPGIIELLDTIGADADLDDNVRFPRPRWAEAVVNYYWLDRQDNHDRLIRWLTELPHSDTFQPTSTASVAERVSEVLFDLIMKRKRVDILGEIIDRWGEVKDCETFAWRLLDAASLHPVVGRDVHTMMLRWSKSPSALGRRRAVAAVCGLEFGRVHTEKALVRLNHAAECDDPVVVEEVRQAALALWREPDVGRVLLRGVIKRAADDAAKQVTAARNIFTTLAAAPSPTDSARPDLLVRALFDQRDMELTVEGWRCLLVSEMDGADLLNALRPWFEAGLKDSAVGDEITDVLGRATGDRMRSRERLQKCLDRWLGGHLARDDSPAGRLARQVGRASTSDPAAPEPPSAAADEADPDE